MRVEVKSRGWAGIKKKKFYALDKKKSKPVAAADVTVESADDGVPPYIAMDVIQFPDGSTATIAEYNAEGR